jgi:NAD-dependent SIR2 family protein deacetylase
MLLQRAVGTPGPLLTFHRALAALARSKHVHTVITTNYDDLVERGLAEAGVPHVVQTFERNFDAVSLPTVRVLKVHGSQHDWGTVVLSGSVKSLTLRWKSLLSVKRRGKRCSSFRA